MTIPEPRPESIREGWMRDGLLTDNERQLAIEAWATKNNQEASRWGNLVLEVYDACAADLAAAEQERDGARESCRECDDDRHRLRAEREQAEKERDEARAFLRTETMLCESEIRALTEDRDRLAAALKRIADGTWKADAQRFDYDIAVFAREALAAKEQLSRADKLNPRYCDEATDSGHSSANGLDSRDHACLPPSPPPASRGWMCPKCGRVYSPITLDCRPCNLLIETYGPRAAGLAGEQE